MKNAYCLGANHKRSEEYLSLKDFLDQTEEAEPYNSQRFHFLSYCYHFFFYCVNTQNLKTPFCHSRRRGGTRLCAER